jgi:hypothetical protein
MPEPAPVMMAVLPSTCIAIMMLIAVKEKIIQMRTQSLMLHFSGREQHSIRDNTLYIYTYGWIQQMAGFETVRMRQGPEEDCHTDSALKKYRKWGVGGLLGLAWSEMFC